MTFVQNNTSPQFIDIEIDKEGNIKRSTGGEANYETDFFRIKVLGETLSDDLKQIKWKRVSYEVATKVKSRGDLKFSDSPQTVLEKYVGIRGGDLDKKKLMEVGRRYV